MFESPDFPKSLDEEVFNSWLKKGRLSNMGYKYLLVIWDEYESAYYPAYAEHRHEISQYDRSSYARERLVAAYDLYSEGLVG